MHYWKRQFKNDDPDAPLRAIRQSGKLDNHYGKKRRVYLKLRQQPAFKAVNQEESTAISMAEMGLKGVGYNKQ